MKKTILGLSMLVATHGLVGCGSEGSQDTTSSLDQGVAAAEASSQGEDVKEVQGFMQKLDEVEGKDAGDGGTGAVSANGLEDLTEIWEEGKAEPGASVAKFEEIYGRGTAAGPLPTGQGKGKPFFINYGKDNKTVGAIDSVLKRIPGSKAKSLAELADLVAPYIWQGKVFVAKEQTPNEQGGPIGTLNNMIIGREHASAVIRRIGKEGDGKPNNIPDTFFLDYSKSSWPVVRTIQDYVRKVEVNGHKDLYLGKAFLGIPGHGRILVCYFALDFSK